MMSIAIGLSIDLPFHLRVSWSLQQGSRSLWMPPLELPPESRSLSQALYSSISLLWLHPWTLHSPPLAHLSTREDLLSQSFIFQWHISSVLLAPSSFAWPLSCSQREPWSLGPSVQARPLAGCARSSAQCIPLRSSLPLLGALHQCSLTSRPHMSTPELAGLGCLYGTKLQIDWLLASCSSMRATLRLEAWSKPFPRSALRMRLWASQ